MGSRVDQEVDESRRGEGGGERRERVDGAGDRETEREVERGAGGEQQGKGAGRWTGNAFLIMITWCVYQITTWKGLGLDKRIVIQYQKVYRAVKNQCCSVL